MTIQPVPLRVKYLSTASLKLPSIFLEQILLAASFKNERSSEIPVSSIFDTEKAGIFKKLGGRYEVQDGRKLYEKNIMANPEEFFTQEVLEKINEVIRAEFSYGEGEETTEDLYQDEESIGLKSITPELVEE